MKIRSKHQNKRIIWVLLSNINIYLYMCVYYCALIMKLWMICSFACLQAVQTYYKNKMFVYRIFCWNHGLSMAMLALTPTMEQLLKTMYFTQSPIFFQADVFSKSKFNLYEFLSNTRGWNQRHHERSIRV